LVTAAPKIRG